jgi:hypothetical protein
VEFYLLFGLLIVVFIVALAAALANKDNSPSNFDNDLYRQKFGKYDKGLGWEFASDDDRYV